MTKQRGPQNPTYRRKGRYANGVYAYVPKEDREIMTMNVPANLVESIIALSWLRGGYGEKSFIARPLLIQAVNRAIAELDPNEKREFEDVILPNVQAVRSAHRKKRREWMYEKNASLRTESETEFIPEFGDDQDAEESEP